MKSVGPTPLPDKMYAARQLPVRRAVFWATRSLFGLSLVVGVFALFVVSLYRLPSAEPLLEMFGRTLPMPVAVVNGEPISYKVYLRVLDGWESMYEQDGTIDAIDLDIVGGRVMDRLIEQSLAGQYAKSIGVKLEDEAVQEAYLAIVRQEESEVRFVDDLEKRFGWSKDEFIANVVEPVVLMQVLDDTVRMREDEQTRPREVIDRLRADILAGESSFTQVASEISASISAETGGELGLRSIEEYPEEARSMLLSVSEGSVSEVVDLRERFVVYELLERVERQNGYYVNAQELSVDKRDIHDVIAVLSKDAKIKRYVW